MRQIDYETKLKGWLDFRSTIETSINPFKDVFNYYTSKMRCKLSTDPWNRAIWPSPWELLYKDRYCNLMLTLGSCYTLQLTDRFKDYKFEIHISIDRLNEELFYPLHVDDKILCYSYGVVAQKSKLPTNLVPQRIYKMPRIQ